MKNIRNCKIRVLNAEHSKAVQEKAFEMGFKWPGYRKEVNHCDRSSLIFYSDLICWGGECDFSESENNEIFFYNGEFHHEPESKKTDKDNNLIDVRSCKIHTESFTCDEVQSIVNILLGVGVDCNDCVAMSCNAIYINDTGVLYADETADQFYLSPYKEIFFYDGKFHYEPKPEETNGDIKTHPIFDNGFQYGEVVCFNWRDRESLGVYIAPSITNDTKSVIMISDGNKLIEVYTDHLEKQSDYEDRKNLENLSSKIANLFAASVETVYPTSKLMNPDSAIFLEFTKRLKSEDLLPF